MGMEKVADEIRYWTHPFHLVSHPIWRNMYERKPQSTLSKATSKSNLQNRPSSPSLRLEWMHLSTTRALTKIVSHDQRRLEKEMMEGKIVCNLLATTLARVLWMLLIRLIGLKSCKQPALVFLGIRAMKEAPMLLESFPLTWNSRTKAMTSS